MSETTELLSGCTYGADDVIDGECYQRKPVAVFVSTRRDGEYPQTHEDFLRFGLARIARFSDLDCATYQHLARIGAPVLACTQCPLTPCKEASEQ